MSRNDTCNALFEWKEIEVDRSYFFNDFLPRMDVNKFDAILSGICGIIEKVYFVFEE